MIIISIFFNDCCSYCYYDNSTSVSCHRVSAVPPRHHPASKALLPWSDLRPATSPCTRRSPRVHRSDGSLPCRIDGMKRHENHKGPYQKKLGGILECVHIYLYIHRLGLKCDILMCTYIYIDHFRYVYIYYVSVCVCACMHDLICQTM